MFICSYELPLFLLTQLNLSMLNIVKVPKTRVFVRSCFTNWRSFICRACYFIHTNIHAFVHLICVYVFIHVCACMYTCLICLYEYDEHICYSTLTYIDSPWNSKDLAW